MPTYEVKNAPEKYGGIYFYTSAGGSPTALAINIVNQYHGIALTPTGSNLNGWTFKAGLSGAISAVADNSGGTILVTTSAPHGLSVGDYVCHTGFTTRTTYRGKYKVLTTPLTTTYTVTRAFEVATDTGFFQRAKCLIAGVGAAGVYYVTFSISAQADSNTTEFRYEVNLNATDLDNIVGQVFYDTLNRAKGVSSSGIVTIADGDVLYVSMKNITDANDMKVWVCNLNVHRL
jgi:hypothetical protein